MGNSALLKGVYRQYQTRLAPRLKTAGLLARKGRYLLGTDVRFLGEIKTRYGGSLIDNISERERVFIELKQKVDLMPTGSTVESAFLLVEGLRIYGLEEFGPVCDKANKAIYYLQRFTPFEIRNLYRAFTQVISQKDLGWPIKRINRHAKDQVIEELIKFEKDVQAITNFGEKELISKEIEDLLRNMVGASINSASGIVNYLDDMAIGSRLNDILGHEAGHVIYDRCKISWKGFSPLSPWHMESTKGDRDEEDFCDNFSLYLNGFALFYLLSKTSREWSRKFEIMQSIARPRSFLPNYTAFWTLFSCRILPALTPYLSEMFKMMNGNAGKVSADPIRERHIKFLTNDRDVKKQIDTDLHRRTLAVLVDSGLLGKPLEMRYKGKQLEEYVLNPAFADLIKLLGHIPKPVQKALDANEGPFVTMYLQPSAEMTCTGTVRIATADGFFIEPVFKDADPDFRAAMSVSKYDSVLPLSERAIRSSIEADKLPRAERAEYYIPFEDRFGITLVDTEHRAFSKDQLSNLSKTLEKIPPHLIKGLKIARIHSIDEIFDGSQFARGTFHINDISAVYLSNPRYFLYFSSLPLSGQIFLDLQEKRNEALTKFLDSGGWRSATDEPEDRFLPLGRKSIASDFSSFFYFSIALPDIMSEIAGRNPEIARRLELFREILKSPPRSSDNPLKEG